MTVRAVRPEALAFSLVMAAQEKIHPQKIKFLFVKSFKINSTGGFIWIVTAQNISREFELMTSRYQCDALTNWAMKPLMLGAGQFCVHMFPWKRWMWLMYMKWTIIWLANCYYLECYSVKWIIIWLAKCYYLECHFVQRVRYLSVDWHQTDLCFC